MEVNVALMLARRGRQKDAQEVIEHLVWAHREAAARGFQEAAQIAKSCASLGIPLPES